MEFERWPKFGKTFRIWKKFLALDRQKLVSVVRAKPVVRGFPCGKRVRWLGWSRLTDLAQLHGISTWANVERILRGFLPSVQIPGKRADGDGSTGKTKLGHPLKDQSKNRRSHLPGYAAWEIHPVMQLTVQ